VSDRIDLTWQTASEELAAAFSRHRQLIADEVLAVEITRGDATGGIVVDVNGHDLTVRMEQVAP
jgi:hypothetical protein